MELMARFGEVGPDLPWWLGEEDCQAALVCFTTNGFQPSTKELRLYSNLKPTFLCMAELNARV